MYWVQILVPAVVFCTDSQATGFSSNSLTTNLLSPAYSPHSWGGVGWGGMGWSRVGWGGEGQRFNTVSFKVN